MARLIYKDPLVKVPQPKSLIVYLPKELKPYQFSKRRNKKLENPFNRPVGPEENLNGYVHGKKASALEERFAKALDFFGIEYIFQFEVESVYSLPGEGKLIDFIVFDGGLGIPVEIGASFVHDSPSKEELERVRQTIVNPILQLQGILPLGDPQYSVDFDRPLSFEDAKDIVSSMFISA